MDKIRHSYVGRKYISVCWTLFCEMFLNTRNTIDVSKIRDSHSFFEQNTNRIKEIESWLADDFSVETFQKVIVARSTGNYKDLASVQAKYHEYFPEDIMDIEDNEIFMDCGAFNGDTIRRLLRIAKRNGKQIEKIYALEPAELSFCDLKRYCQKVYKRKKHPQIVLKNCGAWNEKGVLSFSDNTGVGAKIDSWGGETINVERIDDICKRRRVSFIKMDIEGAEWNALHGASETIQKWKPKLAICLYHSDEDILRLAEYVHQIVPEYKIYIRHYYRVGSTIMYCVRQ